MKALAFRTTGEHFLRDGLCYLCACVTVTVFPATVNDPERLAVAVLAATENETDPLPEPETPAVTLSQAVLVEAVQLHPGEVAATVTARLPPPAGAARLIDVTEKLQVNPAWLIVNLMPAMVIVPERAAVLVLAATL